MEGHGSVNGSQTDKLCHYEAHNTVLPSNKADTTTRSLSGHIQRHPECLKQCIAAQRVPDPCGSVGKLHEFLPDCGKIPAPYQHLQVTQWMHPLMERKNLMLLTEELRKNNSPPPKKVPKTAPVASSRNSNVKKHPQAQNKGKGKAPATKPYSQGYRISNNQQNAMENVFQMARTIMELQKKVEAKFKYQKMISDILDGIPNLYIAINDVKSHIYDKKSLICNNLKTNKLSLSQINETLVCFEKA
ncbi:hypothetical protein O181_084576 [Austropuccinia psidii MF-1]|uniref:Uncharacterized protein n=1 Tax=Austropuccinia psidii MF-1 TaxID=1389203 RepID=A0A9Q3FR96_9BASI|nr:hypothetical protein [Austropuccinia psidii MF-1]